MSDEIEEDDNLQNEEQQENQHQGEGMDRGDLSSGPDGDKVTAVGGLYQDWFLDYASYVILERAVPNLADGLKPVQRRILHSMKEMDDGRYNKVANIIGNTMKFHPHGDQSIGDALVQLGQKDLLIDCQGNWGNTLTGDSAAAPRYIEARLSKFANHVVFNPKTTEWLASYDGRNKEPLTLPVKFPLLLAQGAEGIAVGMACKMVPHNFNELIDASISLLRGKKVEIFPDFPNGGMADFSNYNDGLRGGKVRVRAKINKLDNKTLVVTEIPYGTTTSSLIDSIIKANDKGKIKVKKIEDNTSAIAEIVIHLAPGVSPDKSIDALYAFTDCEVSISPNASVIDGEMPRFLGVSQLLKISTDNTVKLLQWELEIKKAELEEQWHFASLEKIFIEKRIYRRIEEEETWEGVISTIDEGLKPHIKHLKRKVTVEDITRLTEIRIKRISKFDSFKADELIAKIEAELESIQHNLDNLVEFAIDYFKDLKKRFGEGRDRKTEIRTFDTIQARTVIIANKKLYLDREEGFIGWNLKKAEYIADCSEIDNVIVFFDTGKMIITPIAEKKFIGKGIVYCGIWKNGDKRTMYHMMYQDGLGGPVMMKRFFVNAGTRDSEYDLTRGTKKSKLVYFSVHPNGERELVTVHLRPRPHLKRLRFDIDFGEVLIKSRTAAGNRVTKELVSKVTQKEVLGSTLGARKIWYDEVVKRLNDEGRGKFLGDFKGNDRILTLYQSGQYRLSNFDISTHFEDDMIHIEKWHPERPLTCVYFDPEKDMHLVKRFYCEITTDKLVSFLPEVEGVRMEVISTAYQPEINIVFNKLLKATKNLPDKRVELSSFIEVKGMKALGNQLTKLKTKEIQLVGPIQGEIPWPEAPKSAAQQNDDDSDFDNEDIDVTIDNNDEEDSTTSKSNDDVPFEIEWTIDKPEIDLDSEKNDDDYEEPPQMKLF
jgi:topoisomerase-4 subunit A